VIEPEELAEKTGYTRPHTVHCMPGDNVVVSMLGDREGAGAGGFAVLDARTFELKGRWENGGGQPPFNYDFWYQPRKNVLVSSEFGEPNAYEGGFDIEDVGAGRYGQRLHFWDLAERRLEQTIDLGENGLIPLEVRWLHDPEAEAGFVGAALSSNMFRWHRPNGSWEAEQVISVENVELEGWPLPGGVPGLITDLLVSMDDRFLYFQNWLHGDLRQYDISDPANPRLTGQLWLGGLLGKPNDAGRDLNGGPQMLQLSLDGRRLYVTNSLYSTWDNQFYPGLRSWLLRVNCSPDGGMEVDPGFFVDFHDRADGPARAHEVRLQGGDCTTEISNELRQPCRGAPDTPGSRRRRGRSAIAGDDRAVMNPPGAHIGGIPIEETLGSFGPALLIALGAAMAILRARFRRVRSRRRTREARRPGAAESR